MLPGLVHRWVVGPLRQLHPEPLNAALPPEGLEHQSQAHQQAGQVGGRVRCEGCSGVGCRVRGLAACERQGDNKRAEAGGQAAPQANSKQATQEANNDPRAPPNSHSRRSVVTAGAEKPSPSCSSHATAASAEPVGAVSVAIPPGSSAACKAAASWELAAAMCSASNSQATV